MKYSENNADKQSALIKFIVTEINFLLYCCRNANSEVSGNLKDLAATSCIPPNQRSVFMPYLIFSAVFILSMKLGSVRLWFSQIGSCSVPFGPFAWEHNSD